MILCVCKYGHSRSAAAVRLLHRYGREAIAVGWYTSPTTLTQLCEMADGIIIMDRLYLGEISHKYYDKVFICHVGDDKWRNPYDDELIELLKPMIKSYVQSLHPNSDKRVV